MRSAEKQGASGPPAACLSVHRLCFTKPPEPPPQAPESEPSAAHTAAVPQVKCSRLYTYKQGPRRVLPARLPMRDARRIVLCRGLAAAECVPWTWRVPSASGSLYRLMRRSALQCGRRMAAVGPANGTRRRGRRPDHRGCRCGSLFRAVQPGEKDRKGRGNRLAALRAQDGSGRVPRHREGVDDPTASLRR